MKYEDMGPGPSSPAKESEHAHANHHDGLGLRAGPLERTEPVPAGIVHPDIIEAAIRMLSDQGYRVFRSKDVRAIESSYAVRTALVDVDERFDHLVRSRLLQDVSISVASSDAVRWSEKYGPWGKLIEAKVFVVLSQETEIGP